MFFKQYIQGALPDKRNRFIMKLVSGKNEMKITQLQEVKWTWTWIHIQFKSVFLYL